jgi:hypothetical protein
MLSVNKLHEIWCLMKSENAKVKRQKSDDQGRKYFGQWSPVIDQKEFV